MYVFKDKLLVTNINGSGNDYLTTTVSSTNIANMDYAQSADTLIVVHEDMAPVEITRGAIMIVPGQYLILLLNLYLSMHLTYQQHLELKH